MTDACRAAGDFWAPTWLQGRGQVAPFIQLDHVLTHGFSVVDAGVVHRPKTDHGALWARLSPHHG
jgi:endonuclease/exonuclease/phosphatase (EEP) superfamily protein YafD